jgi:hypothetical protein
MAEHADFHDLFLHDSMAFFPAKGRCHLAEHKCILYCCATHNEA